MRSKSGAGKARLSNPPTHPSLMAFDYLNPSHVGPATHHVANDDVRSDTVPGTLNDCDHNTLPHNSPKGNNEINLEEETRGKSPEGIDEQNTCSEIDLTEEEVCIKCDEGGKLLVCSYSNCTLAVHEECMHWPARFDRKRNFYCPLCWFKKADLETRKARKKTILAKKALSAFLGVEVSNSGPLHEKADIVKSKEKNVQTSRGPSIERNEKSDRECTTSVNPRKDAMSSHERADIVRSKEKNLQASPRPSIERNGRFDHECRTSVNPREDDIPSDANVFLDEGVSKSGPPHEKADAVKRNERNVQTFQRPSIEQNERSGRECMTSVNPRKDAMSSHENVDIVRSKEKTLQASPRPSIERNGRFDHECRTSVNHRENDITSDANVFLGEEVPKTKSVPPHKKANTVKSNERNIQTSRGRSIEQNERSDRGCTRSVNPRKDAMSSDVNERNGGITSCREEETENRNKKRRVGESVRKEQSKPGEDFERRKGVQHEQPAAVIRKETRKETNLGVEAEKSAKGKLVDEEIVESDDESNSSHGDILEVLHSLRHVRNIEKNTKCSDEQSWRSVRKIPSFKEDSVELDDEVANDSSDEDRDDVSQSLRHAGKNNKNAKSSNGERLRQSPHNLSSEQKADDVHKKKSETSSRLKPTLNTGFLNVKRKRRPWTAEEEDMIREGVEKFSSKVNKNLPWRKILEFGRHIFHESRNPVDLKDKWRNILAKEGSTK